MHTRKRPKNNKFCDNNASQAMMLLYAGVPHSSVIYYEMELKAANLSLRVC